MHCLFRCFRYKDDKNPRALLRAEPVLPNAREPVIYKRPLWPLQESLEEQQIEIDEHSPSKDEGSYSSKEERELKAEAGFLKACGTLPETPAEIRKMCTDLVPIQAGGLNEQIITPPVASVHFECQGQSPSSSSTASPYSTPLKLTDEMETPYTAFPSTFTTLGNNKYQRIRSQYVYPILEINHNVHKLKMVKESLDEKIKVMSRIPNTNQKYKEDQKVKWHDTPFEARLERALADGAFASSS